MNRPDIRFSASCWGILLLCVGPTIWPSTLQADSRNFTFTDGFVLSRGSGGEVLMDSTFLDEQEAAGIVGNLSPVSARAPDPYLIADDAAGLVVLAASYDRKLVVDLSQFVFESVTAPKGQTFQCRYSLGIQGFPAPLV